MKGRKTRFETFLIHKKGLFIKAYMKMWPRLSSSFARAAILHAAKAICTVHEKSKFVVFCEYQPWFFP